MQPCVTSSGEAGGYQDAAVASVIYHSAAPEQGVTTAASAQSLQWRHMKYEHSHCVCVPIVRERDPCQMITSDS